MVYWPMGMAMAGACGTVRPDRVVRKIAKMIGPYLLVLLARIISAVLLRLVTAVFLVGLVLFQRWVLLARCMRSAFLLGQYVIIATFASLGDDVALIII